MANYQIYFNLDGGAWFPSGSDPVANTGGIDLSVLEGDLVYPTLQGSGDIQLTANFGATPFVGAVPAGYTAGWPASGGGFTTLDPTKTYGSAVGHVSGGNLVVDFPSVAGMVQAVDGQTTGQYYFEISATSFDVFNVDMGGGVGRDYAAGGSFSFWITGGAFNSHDVNGGGLAIAGGRTTYATNLLALGSTIATNVFAFFEGHTIGVAVFLTGSNPVPVTPSQPTPRSLGRWRGQTGLNWLGMALVGDAFSNVVGLSDFENFTEYGNTMRMLVTTPPIQEDRKRIFFPRLEIEVEAGQPLPSDSSAGAQMMLDWSKDGGKTWSNQQLWRSMGATGEYRQRLRWLSLGQSRQWVFRLSCTDPVRRHIIGVYDTVYRGLG